MNPVMKNDFQCALKQPSFVSPPPSLSLSPCMLCPLPSPQSLSLMEAGLLLSLENLSLQPAVTAFVSVPKA